MKYGCLIAFLLLPISFFIAVRREINRRAAMSPEQRKDLQDELRFGKLYPEIECMYCHEKNCIRGKPYTDTIGSASQIFSKDHIKEHAIPIALLGGGAVNTMVNDAVNKTANMLKANCMACSSHWSMYDPDDSDNR